MKRIIFPAVTVLLISFSCTKTLEDPAEDAICVNGIIPQFFKRTVYAASVRERLDFDLTVEDQSHCIHHRKLSIGCAL